MTNNTQCIIESIIDQARWAPSGDNMQTWRFEKIDHHHFIIHGYDTRDHCVYDLQGHASQLAIGCLIENIAIAASSLKYETKFELQRTMPETNPTIDVFITENRTIEPDPLFPYLPVRSVQRRPLKTKSLTISEKEALNNALGEDYEIKWIEGWRGRLQAALLMYKNAKLRFTLPEAFPTHSTIIEWNARFSEDKIPDKAVGLDPVATIIMKWAIKSWKRVNFLNTFLAGTLLPRIELDLLPGLFCAAHFALIAKNQPKSMQDYLNAGRALQRFWLTATHLNLQLQPEMTPLIFSGYIRNNHIFTQQRKLIDLGKKLCQLLDNLLGKEIVDKVVFIGRIGHGKPAFARSIRLPLDKLWSNHP